MGFWEKIERVDRRVVYLLLIIVVVIPILRPIGIPISVGAKSKAFYTLVDSVPSGGVVVYVVDTEIGGWAELGAAGLGVAQHLFRKPVKIVFVSFQVQGPMIVTGQILPKVDIPPEKKYGTDYTVLGYVAGGETGMAAVAADIHALIRNDLYGTPLTNLPMMKDIGGARDVDLLITATSATDTVEGLLRQWATAYGVKYGIICLGVMGPAAEPFYPTQAQGLMVGSRVGAEYELLIKKPGPGLADMDAQSMAHLLAFVFIALGNIGYLYQRKIKGGTK